VSIADGRIDAHEIPVLRMAADVRGGERTGRDDLQSAGAYVIEGAGDESPSEPTSFERRVDIRVDETTVPASTR
jgi:hypothetical protein